MAQVLFLVSFRVRDVHREAFLKSARERLKPYWESHGALRYEVYDEIGPTGPTGRVTQAYWFRDREAYLAMQRVDDPALPTEPYRFLFEPEYRVLEALLPSGA
jgi:quinol monooxygenase YgiN